MYYARPFDPTLLAELEGLANRGYTDGFYQRHHTQDYQNYITGSESKRSQYVGDAFAGYARCLQPVDVAAGSGHVVCIPLPNELGALVTRLLETAQAPQ